VHRASGTDVICYVSVKKLFLIIALAESARALILYFANISQATVDTVNTSSEHDLLFFSGLVSYS